MTIHASSYHPPSQKYAAYNSMIYRLLHFPLSPENHNKEINLIKHIAVSNGFHSNMIDKLISKFKNRIPKTENEESKRKFICIEYSQTLQNGLSRELKRHDINLAFRTSNRTANILSTKAKISDKFDKCGVYKLSCANCPSTYTGQTGRNFKTRYNEHRPDPRLETQKSSFAQHLVDKNHDLKNIDDGMEILHLCKKGSRLNTLEEYEIYKAQIEDKQNETKNTLNEKLQFKSHLIFNTLLNRTKRRSTGIGQRYDNTGSGSDREPD